MKLYLWLQLAQQDTTAYALGRYFAWGLAAVFVIAVIWTYLKKKR